MLYVDYSSIEKVKLDLCFTTLKNEKDLSMRPQTVKPLDENKEKNSSMMVLATSF